MANSFTYDSGGSAVDMSSLGLTVVGLDGVGLLPEVALDIHSIVGADGSVDDGVRYESRHITVDFVVKGQYDEGPPEVTEWESLHTRLASIAAALQKGTQDNEPKALVFDCMSGYQYFARMEGRPSIALHPGSARGTIQFVCPNPWAEATTQTELTWTAS